jgi:hypothetical protein
MSLSKELHDVALTLECKHCGRSITKKGGWFKVVHRFKCEGCNREVPIGYSDKIALFDRHARLAGADPPALSRSLRVRFKEPPDIVEGAHWSSPSALS